MRRRKKRSGWRGGDGTTHLLVDSVETVLLIAKAGEAGGGEVLGEVEVVEEEVEEVEVEVVF